eukprot:TRINITY_DN15875_c0_g1_i2.p1 TRINITY_DN15875_c0_g1~~TRINITY_DN15875_c0_g1_i2.p1  ORF type:complete len:267 (+),score=39.23 TRINITY_DN15875_c0_g1_i2:80-802(+)
MDSAAELREAVLRLAGGDSEVSLVGRVREAFAAGACTVVVEIAADYVEREPLEVLCGEVVLRGTTPAISDGDVDSSMGATASSRSCLTIPGLFVRGGSLRVSNLNLCATEENRVQEGSLHCEDCHITSKNGCGILCLQRAKVHLKNCEIARCLRSGVGVNGKHTDLDLHGCTVTQNNFSGIGVNHQARSIVLRQTSITNNQYHGVWLNAGVKARWVDGIMRGNRQGEKAGTGTLLGFEPS